VEDGIRSALGARLLWDDTCDSAALTVEAVRSGAAEGYRFDLAALCLAVVAVRWDDGRERIALSDGFRRVPLSVTVGSLLGGPAYVRFILDYGPKIHAQLLTLRRLLAVLETGRFAAGLFRPEPKAARWIAALRAYDAAGAGASQREIATILYDSLAGGTLWRGESEFLRLRIQRLLRAGRRMVAGGYRDLLR